MKITRDKIDTALDYLGVAAWFGSLIMLISIFVYVVIDRWPT